MSYQIGKNSIYKYHNSTEHWKVSVELLVPTEKKPFVNASTCASVIRRNVFSSDKGLSREIGRGGAKTADFPNCAGAGGCRKTGRRVLNHHLASVRPPHYRSAAAALLMCEKLFDIDLWLEK